MNAIEFTSYIIDGTIKVPDLVNIDQKKEIKVIILYNDTTNNCSTDKIQNLIDNPIKMDVFDPLKREEIYG